MYPLSSRPIQTVDYHTAGEPFRIVTGGVDPIPGATVLDRRSAAMRTHDEVRALLINEPRGHADMYGGFVVPADAHDDGAGEHGRLGVVFFHKDGFSTACGHGTIALATWAIESGVVEAHEPVTRLSVDVPSGRLAVEADVSGGRVGEVRFRNIASFVTATAIALHAAGHDLVVDVSYGGAFYASAEAASVGLRIEPGSLDELIRIGRAIKHALNGHPSVQHPTDERLSGCYGTIWHETVADEPAVDSGGALHQRNVTIFADGEVDRSPCGSGTSARLALLHHHGALGSSAPYAPLLHTGIVNTSFRGRVLDVVMAHGRPAVITEVGGRASRTGVHSFVLDTGDELGLGFQLR